jgi:putative membrane protein
MVEIKKQANITDHLANERTFLAWIRTSVGLMAFGFVVVKFSLFVRQVSLIVGKENAIQNRGYSAIVGIILVAVGTLTSVLSYIRYRNTKKQIAGGSYTHSTVLITVITAFIFLVSVLLIAYLIQSTRF